MSETCFRYKCRQISTEIAAAGAARVLYLTAYIRYVGTSYSDVSNVAHSTNHTEEATEHLFQEWVCSVDLNYLDLERVEAETHWSLNSIHLSLCWAKEGPQRSLLNLEKDRHSHCWENTKSLWFSSLPGLDLEFWAQTEVEVSSDWQQRVQIKQFALGKESFYHLDDSQG